MGETEDPRAALKDKSVAVRAAAARDLAAVGTFADLPALVAMAKNADSSALRLYAAAACAEIVHRYRGLADRPSLGRTQRKKVYNWVKTYDPGVNPGLLMMLSALADDASRKRLALMLRDPRNGVRAGAAMALRRMVLSAAAFDDDRTQRTVRECLADERIPPDGTLELVNLVGEAGWADLADDIRAVAGHGRLHGEAVKRALKRIEARKSPEAWSGFWLSDGRDVFESTPVEGDETWKVIGGGVIGDAAGAVPFTLEDGRLQPEGGEPVRLLWAARIGQADEVGPAIQQGDRTWWRLDGKPLLTAIEARYDELGDHLAPAADALDAQLAEVEGTVAPRVRAVVAWRLGAVDHATELLEELVGAKKPRADLFWWMGRVYAAQGRKDDAAKHLKAYLDKAAKRAQYRERAEALLAELG